MAKVQREPTAAKICEALRLRLAGVPPVGPENKAKRKEK
jgi:hypothetical protein